MTIKPGRAAHVSHGGPVFDVKIASTGEVIRVRENETVVAALARSGVTIPVSSSEGICGTCLTRVLEGDVLHSDQFLTEEQRARNDQFTPCCSRARSPMLVLDL